MALTRAWRRPLAALAVAATAVALTPAVASAGTTKTLAAKLTVGVSVVAPGVSLKIDPRGTSVPAHDSIRSWSLGFGDGAPQATGKGAPRSFLSHVYKAVGPRHLKLTVVDVHGRKASAQVDIRVTATPKVPVYVPPYFPPGWPNVPATSSPTTTTTSTTYSPTDVFPTTTTPGAISPSAAFNAVSAGQSVLLSWGYLLYPNGASIVRTDGSSAAATPAAGVLVATLGPGTTTVVDSSVNPGHVYSYAAFARDSSGAAGGTGATARVAVATSSTPTHVCGPIVTDTTWSPANSGGYVLDCPVTVTAGSTLTLLPGTWVKGVTTALDPRCAFGIPGAPAYCYTNPASLIVEGTLRSSGTATSPVVLTSMRDDATGGDTNNDGSVSLPASGDLPPIVGYQVAGTPKPELHLDHTTVSFAWGISTAARVLTTVSASLLKHSSAGITAYAADDTLVSVTGTTVDDVTGPGISVWVDPSDTSGSPTLSGNSVTRASGAAYVVYGQHLDGSTLSGNRASSSHPSAVVVAGTVAADTSLSATDLPWVVGPCHGPNDGSATCTLTVAPRATLTVQAGAVVKADTGAGITVEGGFVGSGALTSLRDDTAGGDTNGDGDGSAPVAADWRGIGLVQVTGTPLPVLSLTGATVGYGSISTNGLSDVTVTSSRLHDAGGAAVTVLAGDGGSERISGNTVSGVFTDGIRVLAMAGVTNVPQVSGNSVSGGSGTAVVVESKALDPSLLAGNTGSGDQVTALSLSGTLRGSVALPVAGLPWIVGSGNDACSYWSGGYYYSYYSGCSGLTVAPGATLTLGPDAVLKVAGGGTITVQGGLVSTGTASDPATITSIADDTAGGDTNGDGNGTIARTTTWSGISTILVDGSPRPKVSLDWTRVAFAGSGLSSSSLADVSVTHSTFVSSPITLQGQLGSVVVDSNTVTGGGITVAMGSTDVTPPTVSNNAVSGAPVVPVAVYGSRLVPAQLLGNTGSGDGIEAMSVLGTLVGDATLPAAGLPWVVGPGSGYLQGWSTPCYGCGLTVGPGVTLTVGPTAVLKLDQSSALVVQGNLTAQGVLTALTDDAFGGDTNTDGNGTIPAQHPWTGIQASQVSGKGAPHITLDHATVRYAGTGVSAVYGGLSKISVSSSTFAHVTSAVAINQPATGSTVSITGSSVDDTFNGFDVQMSPGDTTDVPVVSGNAVTNASGTPVRVTSQQLRGSLLSGNTGSGDHLTAVVIEGSLTGDLTVSSSGLPWVLGPGGVTVAPGTTLDLGAGHVMKAQGVNGLTIQGTLLGATGSALTTLTDDTVGGDTNGDADGSIALPGSWAGVSTNWTGSVAPHIALDGVTIAYARTALNSQSSGGGVTLTHSRLVGDQFGVAAPAYCGAAVDATNTYWGDPSGPAPTGSGAGVSGCVTYTPFATS